MVAQHRCRKQDDAFRQLKDTDPAAWAVGSPRDKATDPTDVSFNASVQPGKEAGQVMAKGERCDKCGTVIG
jgi:hypothetical protein